MSDDYKLSCCLILLAIMVFFQLACTIFWYNSYKYATELYCQSRYFNNVSKYEQCNHKDLIKLLKEKQIIKGEQE